MNEKLTFTDFCRVFEAYREYLKAAPAAPVAPAAPAAPAVPVVPAVPAAPAAPAAPAVPAAPAAEPKSWADVYRLIEQGMQSPQPSVTDPAPKGIDDIITGLIK